MRTCLARYGGHHRVVPDIAADADPQTGMLIGLTQALPNGRDVYSEYRIGGTSLASPLMAGIEALADQYAGYHHGFANPAIYALAGTNAYHDIVNPDHIIAVVRNNYANSTNMSAGIVTLLRTMNQTGTLHTRPGYDDVTGVGTPRGMAYISRMANLP